MPEAAPTDSLRFLTDARARATALALLDAFVAHEDGALPDPRTTGALAALDRMLDRLPAPERGRMRWLLWAIDRAPWLSLWRGPGWWRRFERLDLARRRLMLERWRGSRLAALRAAAGALKSVAMLAYYSRPAAWDLAGYDGPWLGRVAVEVAPVPRSADAAGPLPTELPGTRRADPLA